MNCALTFAKILLLIFNGIFWLFGVAILGIGIWLKVNPEVANYSQAFRVVIDEPIVEVVTWVFIGAGIFVFAAGFVCLIGVVRESKIMLGFYIVCIFTVFAAEVAVGAYAGIRKRGFELDTMVDYGKTYLQNEYTEFSGETSDASLLERQRVSKGFNYLQQKHKCCGVTGWRDYTDSMYLKDLGPRIRPKAIMSYACCQVAESEKVKEDIRDIDFEVEMSPEERDICMTEAIQVAQAKLADQANLCENVTSSFRCEGCMSTLISEADSMLLIVMIIGIVIGVIQLILMILALYFCLNISGKSKN